jgi:hypothetical protein
MKIGAIQNLDLENINRVISEINVALEDSGTSEEESTSTGHLIVSEEIGSPVTEIVADNLDLNKAEIWGFNAHLRNSNNTPSYSLYFNNDKNATNYHITTISTTNGAAVGAAAATNSTFRTAVANGTNIITGAIVLVKEIKEVYVQYNLYGLVAEYLQVGTIRYTLRPEHENIFKMVISSSVENAIAKFSHLKIYKLLHND